MSDVVGRLNEALRDRYRIERELGEGGMATVYLADDLKHERKVALKVLKPELAAAVGAERFLAEIKTTANLQHPHILPLFDSGEADSFLFYVMPYVQGESLRDRLDRDGQLPVDEAVRIARDVADALHAAHGQGVIHRDIKPANVLLSGGRPLLADFGIALAVSAAGGGRMTSAGMSLGTPYYMSPEQASAERDPNAASDVYSLACVLYEMLVGEPPFTGSSVPAVLAKILTGETPSPTQARPSIPANVDAAIRKGLERLSADRFTTAQDFARALSDPGFRYAIDGVVRDDRAVSGRMWSRPTVAFAITAVVLGMSTLWLAVSGGANEEPADGPVVSFRMTEPVGAGMTAVASDGTIAFTRDGELFVRRPDALEASRLRGTENEAVSFDLTFSPDGTEIAFLAGDLQHIKKVPTVGGNVQTIWTVDEGGFIKHPSWGEDGWIYFSGVADASSTTTHIWRVRAVGGSAEVVWELGDDLAYFPFALPGGRGITFTPVSANITGEGVVLLDRATGDTTWLVPDGLEAKWSPTGHLLYAHLSGTLMAMPFDLDGLVATGPSVPVVEGVAVTHETGQYALSRAGTLVYVAGEAVGERDFGSAMYFVDSGGRAEPVLLPPSSFPDARVSPDGRSLAYVDDALIVFDIDRGSRDTLYTGPSSAFAPVWSPDGARIAYSGAGWEAYTVDVDRATEPVRLGGVSLESQPTQWLEDGTVLFTAVNAENADVYSVPADASAAPAPLFDAGWGEWDATVSPDRRSIAYVSDRDGTRQLYVEAWPDLSGRAQVSDGDAVERRAVWSPDGATLYYQQAGQIMAASLDTRSGFRVAGRTPVPVALPEPRLLDVHPDGRLLISASVAADAEQKVAAWRRVVVTNWFTQLRDRLGN